jgi:acetoacetate decarboxylase
MKAYRRLGTNEGNAMPAHRPYYPPLPSYYRDVEIQSVYFRADPNVVYEYLPEPLEPDPDGLAAAWSIKVPFNSAYGPFHETALAFKATFRGRPCLFDALVYLDNCAAICSGRERWGAPKEYAQVIIQKQGNLMYSQTIKDGVPIMTITSSIAAPARSEEIPDCGPSYRLKLIPRADGPDAAIKQIITVASTDVVSHMLFKGNASLEFHASANSDLPALGPVEVLDSFWEVSDFTEGYGEVVYDYLTADE